jgi:D-3-phosphoglycerate dehydrogenase / 2-oxoglutarate reductase
MPHILIAGKIHPSGMARIQNAPGFTYDYVEEVSEASFAPLIHKADGLVIRTQPCSAATIALADKLKIVSRHGVGYDTVDLQAVNARGIALAVCGDVNSVSVAEHSMMLILAATKQTVKADTSVRNGEWGWRNLLAAREVSGKNLLIIGYGRIGRHLARMASGFSMNIRAYDPYLEKAGWPAGNVTPVSTLEEGLRWADAVSVNVPHSGKALIGVEELAWMRPNAVLVNTARGGVIDEAALVAALKNGVIAGAGVDVFETEPPTKDNALFGLHNAILTPHIAGLTTECAERMAISSVQNALDFFNGCIDQTLVVNRDAIKAVA